jgi:hypothetical protein
MNLIPTTYCHVLNEIVERRKEEGNRIDTKWDGNEKSKHMM